jgi:hypothetical protein
MGLLGSLFSAAVKTVIVAPIAVVADVLDVADGEVPTKTVTTLASAVDDVIDGVDSLI